MSTYFNLLTPALAPNAVLSLEIPYTVSNDFISSAKVAKKAQIEETQHKAKDLVERSVVKQYEFVSGPEAHEVGVVQRLSALGWDGGSHHTFAAADSNHRISVFDFRFRHTWENKTSRSADEESNDEDDESEEDSDAEDERDVEVKEQYHVKPGRKSDAWVNMELFDDAILSSLTSGSLSYQPRSSNSSPADSSTARTHRLPSPLTCFQTVRQTASKPNGVPSHFIAAGKEVEISLWDLERTLAGAPAPEAAASAAATSKGQAKKRKKDQLEAGEVWRAKNVPHNHLNLRIPVHHLSATVLPGSKADATLIATGTKSGHVRRYDTRQREPAGNWKVAREGGGVKMVQAGRGHELFFGDTTSLLGSMDLRTGKVLYAYPQQTCTTSHVLPLWMPDTSHSEKNTIGMVSLASDATLRLHSTSSPPIEAKHNVTKGVILGGIPGIGLGNPVFGGYLHTWHPDENGSDAGSDDEDVQGDVWDDMAVVDDVSDGSDSDEDMEEQVKKKRKAQTKPKPRED